MRFQCSSCNGIVAVDNQYLGAKVQCGHCKKVVTVPESLVAPGAVVADFIIQRELGRGGMGVVYLSHQISLDRSAALKVLAENYANDSQFIASFIREARAAAKLNHPHIVQAYAVGEDNGLFYFAMEAIDGQTMKQVLEKQGKIPCEQALQIIQEIADALSYAWHEQKLIHRDIKPDNIMLTVNGRAKLSDLGLASIAGEIDDSKTDEIMGTPQYISPEHLTGAPLDARSDIYSLGATFYHFVTGKFPYTGRNAAEIAKQHLSGTLIPPCEVDPSIPKTVSAIIVKMMERNPQDRYQNAEQLVDDIRTVRHSDGDDDSVQLLATAPKSHVSADETPNQISHSAKKSSGTKTHIALHKAGSTTMGISKTHAGVKPTRKQKKKGGNALLVVLLLLIVLGGAGGGVYYYLSIMKKKAPPKAVVEKVTLSPMQQEMEKIRVLAKYHPEQKQNIFNSFETFLTGPVYKEDRTPQENILLVEISESYHPIDEENLQKSRESLMRQHEEIMEREQKRRNEEKAKAEEEKRKIAEAETKRRQAEADAKRKADELKKKLEEQKQKLENWKIQLNKDVLQFCDGSEKDVSIVVKNIRKSLETYTSNLSSLTDLAPELQKQADAEKGWSKQFAERLKKPEQIRKACETGKNAEGKPIHFKIAGTTFELKKDKLVATKAKGGVKAVKKLSKMKREEKMEMVSSCAEAIDAADGVWLYYLLQGNQEGAAAAAGDDADYQRFKAQPQPPAAK